MNLFRQPFPLTDEQVIREALKTVTEYSNCHPGDTFNTTCCIDQTLAAVKTVWKNARHYSPHQTLKQDDLAEITKIYNRICDDLRTRAAAKIMECLKRRRIREIDIATADALISAQMRKRGYCFFFTWQKLRVKVTIKIPGNRALIFAIKYKDIRDGKLDGIIEDVVAVVDAIVAADTEISVWPLNGSWKYFTGWQN